ncbi:hypothetical protein HaLaN_25821 [Haematococcus lacustris]|uniref:Uncharacterized protein n=1 Tax=Haematococcus lacustris TaxID=44745 RepID=A0A699ZXV7_HAELA|nr:hypothetical protein HaLaN_25821 [Haematococcus lacustris]
MQHVFTPSHAYISTYGNGACLKAWTCFRESGSGPGKAAATPCLTVVPPHAGHNALGYVNGGSGAVLAHDTPRKPSSAAQSFPDGNKPLQGEQAAPGATAPEVVVVMEGPQGLRGKGAGDAMASPTSGQEVGVTAPAIQGGAGQGGAGIPEMGLWQHDGAVTGHAPAGMHARPDALVQAHANTTYCT